MGYESTLQLLLDLEKKGHLKRITEEVDPCLEMAEIQRRMYQTGGPAILFERVKGSPFPAAGNIFGTPERVRYIFRDSLETLKNFMNLKGDPGQALKNPVKAASLLPFLTHALPRKQSHRRARVLRCTTSLESLPGIISWQKDGGRYITLPQVYTEHPDAASPMGSNLGMYRVQLDGNSYAPGEIGLHYQIHRGIAHHHRECLKRGIPLKVSIFVGGPPAMTLAAVMPLPDNVPEIAFAGLLNRRAIRYSQINGHRISADADFCITGEIIPGTVKPEGPFGDHLGYYSLVHDMPVMKVNAVYHRENAVWPFTVVGRPPQEDTEFGAFIHEITRPAIKAEVSGLKEVHAVDEAGVHPLLLAIGSERYVPYLDRSRPAELLTIANGILGRGQLSLAKYLFITAEEDDPALSTADIPAFFRHVLCRVSWERDLHFMTKTTIDTLDYSGEGLNRGSKVTIAVLGSPARILAGKIPASLKLPPKFINPRIIIDGIMVVEGPPCKKNDRSMEVLVKHLNMQKLPSGFPLIIIVDDANFTAGSFSNFLWVTFTRSNPSADIYGVHDFIDNKHWGCRGPLLIDARIKPHHAPPLREDSTVSKKVDDFMKRNGLV